MPEKRIVLDTNAIIFFTAKGNIISNDLYNELNDADLYISVITEIELFAKSAMIPEEENKLRGFITDRLLVINLTNNVKNETIALRRANKLKLPDCIVAATAITLNAQLLTSDNELLRLKWPGFNVKNYIQ